MQEEAPIVQRGACVSRRSFLSCTAAALVSLAGAGRALADDSATVVSALPSTEDTVATSETKQQVPTTLPSWVDEQTAQTLLSQTGDDLVDQILIDAEQLGQLGESLAAKLLKLAAENPDAHKYVAEFLESYPGKTAEGLTEADLVDEGVPHFMQWDQRWGYMQYLEGPMGTKGCCPTCLSMLYCALTKSCDMSPYLVSLLATESGHCDAENGTYGEFVQYFADHMGFDFADLEVNSVDPAANALNDGWLLVCNLAPGTFTDVGHYVLVTGWSEDVTVNVNDPYTTSVNQQAWPLATVVFECNSMYALRLKAPQEAATTTETTQG